MGELTVSGGSSGAGSTAVDTAELFAEAARLGAFASVLDGWRAAFVEQSRRLDVVAGSAAGVPLTLTRSSDPLGAAAVELMWGRVAVERASDHAAELHRALVEAGERYGATEASIEGYARLGGQIGAWVLGFGLRVMPIVTVQAIAAGAAAIVLERGGDLDAVLNDPEFAAFVAIAVDSLDEVVAGALLVPLPLAAAVGEGIRAPESASALLGAAGLLGAALGSRVLVDGAVRVSRPIPDGRADQSAGPRVSRTDAHPLEGPVSAPAGVGDLVDRIPTTDGGAQIRVERYGEPGDPRWVVYIGGTVDFSLTAGTETHDMTSNLHGIADDAAIDALRFAGAESGAGERAVRAALAEAGAQPGDPILSVGHSGGGVVAAGLAADPELNVVAAVSVGGPVASAEIREGVPLLSVEHAEDPVPATGGTGHPSPGRLTVSRSVLEEGTGYDEVLPAHGLVRYRETAQLIDASEEERLVAFRRRVAEFTGDGTGEMTRWIGTRGPDPGEPGPGELSPSSPDAARAR
ncbi:hypothetical protein [Agromyces laixinhei]|uniref:hypothetical protein n=1 Tax=Agromyces laixinhei TaxID=2585717 RepID=UPI0012EDF219|nr:hypothetical protein [Agromyces laixinhei]